MRNLVLALLLLSGSLAVAQPSSNKTSVFFSCTCSDAVGKLYATALRDAIAASPRYKEAAVAEEKRANGKTDNYHWAVKAVSLDPSNDNNGVSTVISVVILLGDSFYFTNVIQTCGRSVDASCAASTLASLDEQIHNGSN